VEYAVTAQKVAYFFDLTLPYESIKKF